MRIVFRESAAPLKQIENAGDRGHRPVAAVAGTWFWTNDKELRFTPATTGRSTAHSRCGWPRTGCSRVRCGWKTTGSRSGASHSREDHREPVLSGPARSEPEEARRDRLVQPSRGSAAARIARRARGRQGRGLSRADAGQPALHGRVRQVQARRLHALGRAWHAARRHADDAARRQRRARRARRQRHAAIGSSRSSPSPGARACAFRTRAWPWSTTRDTSPNRS